MKLLVDKAEAERSRAIRSLDRSWPAVERQRSDVRLLDPGENLDQRRLACAVRADEPVDLARANVDVDASKRMNAAERLGKPPPDQKGGRPCHRGLVMIVADQRRRSPQARLSVLLAQRLWVLLDKVGDVVLCHDDRRNLDRLRLPVAPALAASTSVSVMTTPSDAESCQAVPFISFFCSASMACALPFSP